MAGDAKKLQPIIIKRVKKGGHAAHGGAWKIAYADFVTCLLYTSPSPRDYAASRMPSSA